MIYLFFYLVFFVVNFSYVIFDSINSTSKVTVGDLVAAIFLGILGPAGSLIIIHYIFTEMDLNKVLYRVKKEEK